MADKTDLDDKTETEAGGEPGINKVLHMHKRVERKEDGRHLLYYSFGDKMPLPDNSQKAKGS